VSLVLVSRQSLSQIILEGRMEEKQLRGWKWIRMVYDIRHRSACISRDEEESGESRRVEGDVWRSLPLAVYLDR